MEVFSSFGTKKPNSLLRCEAIAPYSVGFLLFPLGVVLFVQQRIVFNALAYSLCGFPQVTVLGYAQCFPPSASPVAEAVDLHVSTTLTP